MKKFKIVGIVSLLLHSLTILGGGWNADDHWSVNYVQCEGYIDTWIRVYDRKGNDSKMGRMELSYKTTSGNYVKVLDWSRTASEVPGYNRVRGIDGNTYYHRVFHTATDIFLDDRTTGSQGGSYWIRVRWFDVPDEFFGAKTEMRLRGRWDGCTVLCSGNNFFDVDRAVFRETEVQQSGPSDPTGISAGSDEFCDRIRVSWNNPSLDCSAGKYTALLQRRLSGSSNWDTPREINLSSSVNDRYDDFNIVKGEDYDYRVRIRFKPNFAREDVTTAVSTSRPGRARGPLDPPSNVRASSGNCSDNILVEWDWSAGSTNLSGWRVERRVKNPQSAWTIIADNLSASDRNYENSTSGAFPPSPNELYEYRVYSLNTCTPSDPSAVDPGPYADGVLPGAPNAPVVDSIVPSTPNDRITVHWSYVSTPVDEGFVIERQGDGGSERYIVNDPNARSFPDNNVQQCINYTYIVKAFSDCFNEANNNSIGNSQMSGLMKPDLTNVFDQNSLEISKGFYPDRVQLEWTTNNASQITDIIIGRRELGSTSSFTTIATLPNNSALYNDINADAGIIYEYQVKGIADCDGNNIESNTITAVGFRLKSGQVSGKVTYQGQNAIAVSDVKIIAESTAGEVGGGLQLNGGQLSIPPATNQALTNEAIVESWLQPSSYASDFEVYDQGCFSVSYIQSANVYRASVSDATATYTADISADSLPVNEWNHISTQVSMDTLYIYVNGSEESKTALPVGFTFDCSASIGINWFQGFQGAVTEARAWNVSKTAKEIFRDHGRYAVGTETGLFVFLPMTEGAGDFAYDRSRINASTFNVNHAAITGGHTWLNSSAQIPTLDQLSFAGFTDENGDYLITLPYGSAGSNYRLTPKFQTHQFSPSSKLLFIGDGSSVINGVDFIDESSFRVTGFINYKNTVCGVEEAFIKVDGEILRDIDGNAVRTDSKGEFDILVPIGQHVISVEKANHGFSQGRYARNFQAPVTDIEFIDSTTVKVIGRVVGGLREASKKIGFGKSKNNIGRANVKFESRNGCLNTMITTMASSGEYAIDLPPLKYTGSAEIPENLGIVFNRPLLNYDETPIPRVIRDSVTNVDGSIRVDSVLYNYQFDLIHRATPIVVVTDKDGVSDFIGDTVLTYQPRTGPTVTRDLKTDPLPWPVFTPNDGTINGKKYKAMVKVYEPYTNFDNRPTLVRDSVPTTDGEVRITNQIADSLTHPIKMKDINTLDTLKSLVVEFDAGPPSFSTSSIEKYSYTRRFEIAYIPNTGPAIFWEPDYLTSIDPMDADKAFRGYVLGSRALGARYFTEGPQRPEFVLRDPPGSNSSASRSVGSTSSYNRSWSWNLGQEAGTTDKIKAGADFTAGFGISLKTTIKNDIDLGFSAEISGGRNGSINESVSTSQTYSTSSTTDLVGAGSDVYIGKSQNIEFGATEDLSLVPVSECANVQCLGPDYNGYRFARTAGIALAPEGYETYFSYSQGFIINYLLPLLKTARDGLLQSNLKYDPHIPVGDPLYGVNNDDERLAMPVDCGNQTPCFETLSGPSYTYMAATEQDSLTGDSVRYINQQIQMWEEAIALNEWEKSVVGDVDVIDSLYREENQKLLDEYAGSIAAQVATGVVSVAALGAITYGIVVAPVPGTATAGAITFGVTTAAGIANAETASRYEEYLIRKTRLDQKFESIRGAAVSPTNRSVSSGNSYSEDMSTSTAISSGGSIEYTISAEQKFDIVAKVNGTGFAFEKGFKTSFDYSRDWGQEESESQSVSFTISDNDQPDFFSVDVYPSMLGWGPIFRKRDGGQTSCPYEDEEYSVFYRDSTTNQPVRLSGKTQQIDQPRIEIAPNVTITNVPANSAASFELSLFNDNVVGAAREYRIQTVSSSNPFGAVIRYDGSPGGTTVAIDGGGSVTKTITVQKGPGARLVYDSILVVMYAPCQYEAGTSDNLDLVDSAYVSVHFLPECTDVSILRPTDQWIYNNDYKDTATVVIGGYDINYSQFEQIKLQFKSTESPEWNDLQSFWVNNGDGVDDPDSLIIPRDAPQIQWDWIFRDEVDGSYDLKATAICTEASKESAIHRGYMDRVDPHAFGSPSPADGILDPNDDILLSMNETVDLGSIVSQNFSVSGLLNGTPLANENSLSFDGVNDHGIIPEYQLQQRSLTIEMWLRREGDSGNREYLLSQGQTSNDQLAISIEPDGRLRMQVGNRELYSQSAINDEDWYHAAFVYDRDSSIARIWLAHDTRSFNSPDNISTNFTTNYQGVGQINVARNSADGVGYFSGAMRDLRLWSVPRSEGLIAEKMSRSLSGREPGLIGAWLMDESYGSIATDKVRSRHMQVVGANWMILPQNHSLVLNGVDDYAVADNAGTLGFTEEADITIEAWFKTGSNAIQTILSNGLSDGSLPVNSFWSLFINGNGQLVLENDGNSITSPGGFNDNNWHHIAVVVDRTFAVSMYIDGDLVTTDNAASFRNFVGPKLWIGCRGWIQSSPLMENRDRFWNGALDDIRIWNVARGPEQVARDYVYQQSGNELALSAYFPFDGVQTVNNVRERIPNLTDASGNGYNLMLGNMQNDTFSINAPSVKLPRLVQNVNFTYSVNNDQIFIEIDEPPARVENVTLDITVEKLKDLAGNSMAEAETWIAFIDKNQVFWETEYFQFEKKLEDNLSFTAKIKNTGGSQERFTLSNLPSWLTASPSSGLIDPNSTIEVEFKVQPLLNIGEYEQDIFVSTESFGFNERLLLDLKVTVDPPVWEVDPDAFDQSMNITGELFINDVISTDPEDMVSVWVSDELRGVSHVELDPASGKNLVFLTVLSNVSSGEVLEFRAWDASRGRLLKGLMPDDIAFIGGGVINSAANPLPIKATVLTQLNYVLNEGWNWISFPLDAPSLADANAVLQELSSTESDQMKSQDQGAAQSFFYSGGSWTGNVAGVTTNLGYKIKVAKADTFRYEGTFVDPSTQPINIISGWNWIGVKSEFIIDVPSAMASLDPKSGDIIKGQRSFAIYDSLFGWSGNLDFLQPQQGYMLRYHGTDQLIFPGNLNARPQRETQLKSRSQKGKDYARLEKNLGYSIGKYSNTMSLTAAVDDCIVLDTEGVLELSQWSLAAHAGEECRGVVESTWIESIGEYRYYLSIEGNSAVPLTFKLVHNSNGKEIILSQNINFETNGAVGMISAPYLFSCVVQDDCINSMLYQNADIDMSQTDITRQVLTDLQSNALLPTGRVFRFKAGQSIEFMGEFEVTRGAILEAYIEDCIRGNN